jgi:hypothetical protein
MVVLLNICVMLSAQLFLSKADMGGLRYPSTFGGLHRRIDLSIGPAYQKTKKAKSYDI